MIRKTIACMTAAAMSLSLLTACEKKYKKDEIRTYTGFFVAHMDGLSEDNACRQAIAEKIGAQCIESWMTADDNDDSEIIGDMIIADKYPDFLYAGNFMTQKLLDANAYIPIDEYWDDYPNIRNYFSDDIWDRIRTPDGHIYYIPVFSNCYKEDTNTIHNDEAFWIQVKVLQWAGYPKITTLDEYFDLIERYIEANPEGYNGEKNIGYEILADESIFFCIENPPQFLDGYPNDGCCIVDAEKQEAVDYNVTPTAKRWFKKLNEEYHKGIVDPECFVLNVEQYYQKIRSGNVLGFADQLWNFGQATNNLPDECTYIPLGVVIDEGVYEHYHSLPCLDSSQGLGISKSCEDINGALQFVNDILDPEIHTLRYWGRKGIDYSVGSDGVFYLTDEQREKRNSPDYATDTECKYDYFPHYGGYDRDGINACTPDYQPRDFYNQMNDIVKECFDAYGAKTYVELLNPAKEQNDPWYPMWSYTNTLNDNTEVGKIKLSIDQTKLEYLPKVVMSSNFEETWKEYMTEYNKNDIETYYKALTEEVRRRAEK